MKKKNVNVTLLVISVIIFLSILLVSVYAAPVGPTATNFENRTRTIATNTSLNESQGGGYIYIYNFATIEQNKRWKAYVGNVTGTLTLDDANSQTIYDWSLGTVSGEVYTTRNVNTVNWTGIMCANSSDLTDEDSSMSHTRLDNISATFTSTNHSTFQVGDLEILNNTCYSIHPYVNDSAQSSFQYFPEIALKDNASKIVFGTKIENNLPGFDGAEGDNNNTYDFQMIVPENGAAAWTSSTAYYFYVELT